MKRFLIGILSGFMLIQLVSCSLENEGYSLSDMYVGFGILHKNSNADMGVSIKLDGGDVLFPIATDIYLGNYDDSSRVLVNYILLGDRADSTDFKEYYVKIHSMRDILMKGILDITPENEDSIGNDPITVKDAWITGNLLNFELKYWGEQEVHFINLVKQPGVLSVNNQPIELELRHNDNGDFNRIPFVAYVSFDLSALQIAGVDSVRFKVTATDYYDNPYEDEGVYHYGSN